MLSILLDIRGLLDENRIEEVDGMLCDIIESAKLEKEQLVIQGKLEVAKKMLSENFLIDIIIRVTELSKEQIEAIEL